jgi:methionyl aminopeptidase
LEQVCNHFNLQQNIDRKLQQNKIYYKTEEEIELIRASNLLVSKTLSLVGEMLKPGVSGKQIDEKAEMFIRDNGGVPSFKGYDGFPATLCVSRNEAVVHGIPGDDPFEDGDILSVDCGVYMNGFHGDSAFTFAIGEVDEEVMKLLRATRESLYLGIEQAVAGNRIGDISHAIQMATEKKYGYGIVRELVGHGVGRDLHEKPEVPNYGRRGRGVLLKEGMVIAIEPMVNLGTKRFSQLNDGWTIITRDRKPSAHYEHSVAVKKGAADILSDHSFVEAAVKNNPELKDI